MTTRAEPKLSPFVRVKQRVQCCCCPTILIVGDVAVIVVRANPSREALACAQCWREARVCAGCHAEITPDVEHFMRWLPKRSQFVAWCLVCTSDPGLEVLRAMA